MANEHLRVRVRFSRLGKARELSHLEQIKLLRKMASESGLPCVFCALGGGRTAKMSFGPAVSVGHESTAEYADLFLSAAVPNELVVSKLAERAGGGLAAISAKRIPLSFPSLESLVNAAEYEIKDAAGRFAAAPALEEFLARSEILVHKKKPSGVEEIIDARPLILYMRKTEPDRISLMLRFGPKRNIKPERIVGFWLEGKDCQEQPEGLEILKKQLYWEGKSGGLTPP